VSVSTIVTPAWYLEMLRELRSGELIWQGVEEGLEYVQAGVTPRFELGELSVPELEAAADLLRAHAGFEGATERLASHARIAHLVLVRPVTAYVIGSRPRDVRAFAARELARILEEIAWRRERAMPEEAGGS
jgi:hypothetical protein